MIAGKDSKARAFYLGITTSTFLCHHDETGKVAISMRLYVRAMAEAFCYYAMDRQT
jgi:hypothetical protein